MNLISIIVPVYNVEKYLDRCLNSLVNQTYKNIEVLIVNDDSPDNSEEIIASYAAKYPNIIKSFKKKNGGLSDARNYGLKKAQGEYIAFVDSDDYVEKDYIEKLYKKAQKENSDITICNIYDEYENQNRLDTYNNYIPSKSCDIYTDKKQLFNRVAAWNKLYKKELFDEPNLKFTKGKIYEDLILTPKLYLKANKISYVDYPLYHYIIRNGSIMNSSTIEKNKDIIYAFTDLINYFKSQNQYDEFKDELEYLVIENILIACSVRIIKISNFKNIKNNLKPFLEFVNQEFPHYYKNKYKVYLKKTHKLILFLMKKRMYFMIKILTLIKG